VLLTHCFDKAAEGYKDPKDEQTHVILVRYKCSIFILLQNHTTGQYTNVEWTLPILTEVIRKTLSELVF